MNRAQIFAAPSPPSPSLVRTLRTRPASPRTAGASGSKLEIAPSTSSSCNRTLAIVGFCFLASKIKSKSCVTIYRSSEPCTSTCALSGPLPGPASPSCNGWQAWPRIVSHFDRLDTCLTKWQSKRKDGRPDRPCSPTTHTAQRVAELVCVHRQPQNSAAARRYREADRPSVCIRIGRGEG